jgi:hypothetical protein
MSLGCSSRWAGHGLARLWRDERGGLIAVIGLAIIPLFGAVGLAVDSSRGYLVKSRLSYAVDAAGLAGGRAFESANRDVDIRMLIDANFQPGYMGSAIEGPTITANPLLHTLTIEARAVVPTAFMGVLGINEMSVSARAVIERELRGMEFVLVMDNTGSMPGNGGIVAIKQAARDLIDILSGGRETVPHFWVGVVPYTATVNIGGHRTGWLTGYDPADFHPTTWKGCGWCAWSWCAWSCRSADLLLEGHAARPVPSQPVP